MVIGCSGWRQQDRFEKLSTIRSPQEFQGGKENREGEILSAGRYYKIIEATEKDERRGKERQQRSRCRPKFLPRGEKKSGTRIVGDSRIMEPSEVC